MISRSLSAVAATLLLLAPLSALAHEHRNYKIGDTHYMIEVGSINEPVFVGDRSGVEVMVSDLDAKGTPEPMADGDEAAAGMPVTGLESTLRVEVSAGGEKKMFDLMPVWGNEGHYSATFYPTAQTTYSYRLTGTINSVPVDLAFTCDPAAGEEKPEHNEEVKVSDNVMQLTQGGAFSCPKAASDVRFPASSSTDGSMTGMSGLVLSLVGIALGATALMRAGKRSM